MSELELQLKEMIISELELEDVEVADIESEGLLFGEGLGLDSIDALELGLAINKRFGVKMDANSEQNKQHFRCVASLAKFIESKKVG